MGETKANTSHRNDEELISTVCHERCWICCYLRYLYIYIKKYVSAGAESYSCQIKVYESSISHENPASLT